MRGPAPSPSLRPPSQPPINPSHYYRCLAARWPCSHLRRSSRCGARLDSATEALLDSFWHSRGVFDEQQRHRLVHIARQVDRSGAACLRAWVDLGIILPSQNPESGDWFQPTAHSRE